MKQLIIPALLALMIAGCSSTPDGSEQDGAPVESRNSGVATVNAGGIDGRNLPAVLTDPKSILSKRSVYFDYDKYEVKAEYKDLVTAHAKFLVGNRLGEEKPKNEGQNETAWAENRRGDMLYSGEF